MWARSGNREEVTTSSNNVISRQCYDATSFHGADDEFVDGRTRLVFVTTSALIDVVG
jgi:hypothetical protein